MDTLIFFPVLFPIAAAVVFNLAPITTRTSRNRFAASVVIANFLLVLILLGSLSLPEFRLIQINQILDIYFKVDKLGMLFGLLVSFLWVCTAFYSFEYMKHEGREKSFLTFFMATLGVTLGIAFSGNLFTLYLFYEFLTLVTFPLVIHNGSREAMQVGRKYLVYSFFGAALVLAGIALLYLIGSDFSFAGHGVLSAVGTVNNDLLLYIYILFFIGFGVKAAVVPLHSWLPSAMVAPTPVSSLLHAVAVVKSGVFALTRVTYYIFGAQVLRSDNSIYFAGVLVALTILLGSVLAFHQDNLKKRLAYSTISQLGYIILGLILLNRDSLTGGLMHLVSHAVIKITLFFCVGAIMYMTGKKTIHEIKGIGREMPVTMWCFSIASVSLIGIPPSNGFVSKWYLALGGLHENRAIFVIILLTSAIFTAAYLIPIIITAFFSGEDDKQPVPRKDPPKNMLVPIIFLTVLAVLLGLFPNFVLDFIKEIAVEVI
ncbi:MAG TPA: proton-conducting transporter membrane subunit [Bacillota bacterium]|nr:proton-conducting transporter membrane subunit [Bacillota bacterium]HPL99757.1 proton-conducting transporter membrane subunit [Bacillota bacterium]HPW39953.1 proton-conducting transporter membrane subunit [Bacillota bacterium]